MLQYRPKGHGRAELTVRLSIQSLRKALESSPEDPVGNTWVHKLPLAMVYFNDLPGA